MAAPAFGTSGVLAYGAARTTSSVPVPASTAANDVIIVVMYQEDASPAVTPPTGFTELTFTTVPVTSTQVSRQRVFWKRATGADSGTYAFTHTSCTTQAVALRYTGALASGTPVEVLGSYTSGATTSTTAPITGTTGGADRAVIYGFTDYTSSTITAPTGFTARTGVTSTDMAAFDKSQATAGTTGSVTATPPSDGAVTATLIGVLPVASAFTGTASLSGSGTLTATGKQVLLGTATLSGSGTLTATGTPAVAITAALGGSGALSASGTATISTAFNGTATFGGSGVLAATGHAGRLVFRGVLAQRRMPLSPPLTALINYSKAVLRINGEWIDLEYPAAEQIEAADIYFPGGYETPVDDATAALLTAAGYVVTIVTDHPQPVNSNSVGTALVDTATVA